MDRNRQVGSPNRRALVIALVYAVLGLVWILVSDALVARWVEDPILLTRLQTSKGWAFIGVTAVVLYFLLLRQFGRDAQTIRESRQYSATMEALRQRDQQLATLMANIPGMTYRCRDDADWTLEFVSEGCRNLTGYSPEELVESRGVCFFDRLHPEDRDRVDRELRRRIRDDLPYDVEFRFQRRDGTTVWIWERGRPVDTDGSTHHEGIMLDISDRKHMERELQRLASHDQLTGLFNRRELERLLANELDRARRYERPIAILWLDIDHFKEVNDQHGHLAGDRLLQQFSRHLDDNLRSVDYVARYGGEELVVVLPEMTVSEAVGTAERLRRLLAGKAFRVGGEVSVTLTVSIGVAVFPDNGASVEALFRAADDAMYKAKHAGRDAVRTPDGADPRDFGHGVDSLGQSGM